MFRLLKLRPPHGWNAVAWELAIVTLGVLIALGAQQIAEAVHDRSTAAETRADVTDELNSDLMSIALRQSIEPCIDRRLSELRAIMAAWERTGTFETPKWVSQSPPIEIELSRYDAALSAGRLALLSGDEQYRMGAVAARIRKFNEWQFAGARAVGAAARAAVRRGGLVGRRPRAIRNALQDASTFDYETKVNSAAGAANGAAIRISGRTPRVFGNLRRGVWPGGKFSPSICSAIDTPPEEANKKVVIPLPL